MVQLLGCYVLIGWRAFAVLRTSRPPRLQLRWEQREQAFRTETKFICSGKIRGCPNVGSRHGNSYESSQTSRSERHWDRGEHLRSACPERVFSHKMTQLAAIISAAANNSFTTIFNRTIEEFRRDWELGGGGDFFSRVGGVRGWVLLPPRIGCHPSEIYFENRGIRRYSRQRPHQLPALRPPLSLPSSSRAHELAPSRDLSWSHSLLQFYCLEGYDSATKSVQQKGYGHEAFKSTVTIDARGSLDIPTSFFVSATSIFNTWVPPGGWVVHLISFSNCPVFNGLEFLKRIPGAIANGVHGTK